MSYDAVIVIDMQEGLVKAGPWQGGLVIRRIHSMLAACREREVPVIYVRHDGGAGDELERGAAGWEICGELAPREGDEIVDKSYNSAFRDTCLRELLSRRGARRLLLCGMQTEYCFDATCKVAFEYGYQVTVLRGGHTTFDNEFFSASQLAAYYEEKIWNNRYANVASLEEILYELGPGKGKRKESKGGDPH